MEKRVVLCVDVQSLRNPAMVGLAGEPLDALPWLECATDAERCRLSARLLPAVEEAWVVSCDDMEPINVAAAIKRDDPQKKVYVVSCGQNGSMASRIANAGIDGLWSESQFLRRFSQVKRACAQSVAPYASSQEDGLCEKARTDVSESSREACAAPFAGPASGKAPATCEASSGALLTPSSAQKAKSATVIAVVSGSGGCGKSTISAIAAALLAKAGLSTIALDADLQFGDLHHLLGVQEPQRIEEFMSEPSRIAGLEAESRKGVALLAAPRKLETSEEIAPDLPRVLSQVASACDAVVVNTGAFWSDVQAAVLDVADSVIFAMDCRPSSLRATVHAVELCARMGVATTSFCYVVNRHKKSSLLSAVDVACSLRGAHAIELPDGGMDVDELLGSGYMQEFLDSRNLLISGIEELLGGVLPGDKRDALMRSKVEPARKRRILFGRER